MKGWVGKERLSRRQRTTARDVMGIVGMESQSQGGHSKRKPSTGRSNKRVSLKRLLDLVTFWLLVTVARMASVGIKPTEWKSIYSSIMACENTVSLKFL